LDDPTGLRDYGQGFRRRVPHGKARSERTEIEAAFAYEFIRRKGSFAYAPIIATGNEQLLLHYQYQRSGLPPGELVLLDVAAVTAVTCPI